MSISCAWEALNCLLLIKLGFWVKFLLSRHYFVETGNVLAKRHSYRAILTAIHMTPTSKHFVVFYITVLWCWYMLYYLSTLGLSMLRKLETLSLAHNLLQADALTGPCLSSLSQLKKLDLGHNLLNQVPQIICEIQMYASALPE